MTPHAKNVGLRAPGTGELRWGMAIGPKIKPLYKRMETDHELRARCQAKSPSWRERLRVAEGLELDDLAGYLGLQRRIVEDG